MDAGQRTVNEAAAALRVSEQWSARTPRGFIWLPYLRAQRIWATEAAPWHGVKMFRLAAETQLFTAAEGDSDELTTLLWLGAEATTSGLIHDRGVVSLHCSVLVYEDNQVWASKLFQVAALVQAMEAQGRAEAIAGSVGREPLVDAHPESGPRTEPDPILSSLTDRAGWAGQQRWVKRDFGAAIEWLGQYGIYAAEGPGGLVAELPFGDGGVNMLRVIKERHPLLGWGVRLKLALDGWPTRPLGSGLLPVELNALERDSWDSGHFVGSWGADRDGAAPYFTCFLPGALYQPGLLEEAITWTGERSMWASHFLGRRHVEELSSLVAR